MKIMKKNIFTRFATIAMACMMLVMAAGATPVQAAGNDYFGYAENHEIGGFTFSNNNTTPEKTVSTDARTHRMILRLWYRKWIFDEGVSDSGIRLSVYVVRANGSKELIYQGVTNSKDDISNVQTNWFSVRPGEKIKFFFDASSSGATNGKYRTCEITQWWGYCD